MLAPRQTLQLFLLIAAVLSAALAVTPATRMLAGPVADFETTLRAAYADYRAVLFHSNTKNAEATAKAIAVFGEKWSALSTKYASPPPQYADDPQWAATLAKVKATLDRGRAAADKGDLPAAHEIFEEIRDFIEDLHLRNGVITFSVRMNAFHHEMEEVLTKKYDGFTPAGLGELREDAAVLAYLADQLKKFPPPEAAGNAEFTNGLQAVIDSVTSVQSAARSGEAAKAREALAKVKPAYSKLFLKFG
jgi:soluble cytochrome b562